MRRDESTRTSYPATAAQLMIVDLDRDDATNPLVATHPRFLLNGRIDKDILFRSIEELVARNKVLSGPVRDIDGVTYQMAPAERRTLRIDCVTFGESGESMQDPRWSELMADTVRSLDLAGGELVRPVLVELAPERHVVLLTIHHVAFDRASVRAVLAELRTCYAALSANQPLPEPPLQFMDLASYLEEFPKTEKGSTSRAFWDRALADAQPLALPTAHSRAGVDAARDAAPRGTCAFRAGGEVNAVIPPPVHAAIDKLARDERATKFAILLAGMFANLFRTTGQDDLTVRTTYSLRSRPGMDSVIGFVANHLLIRVDASGRPSFRELIKRARNALFMAWANGEVPVVPNAPHTLRRLNVNYVPATHAVIQSGPFAPGLDVTYHKSRYDLARVKLPFDLSLWLREETDRTNIQFQYIADLFEQQTMEAFVRRYVETLTDLARDPDAPIAAG